MKELVHIREYPWELECDCVFMYLPSFTVCVGGLVEFVEGVGIVELEQLQSKKIQLCM